MRILVCLILWMASLGVLAEESLQAQAARLKQDVIELNRELYRLEEELLYPADTQLVVYVAMDPDAPFELDGVELTIDNSPGTSYLYSDRELRALRQGGIQRLYTGNVAAGPHEIVAVFNGRDANGRYMRKAARLKMTKTKDAKYLELRVRRSGRSAAQPDFIVREMK
ncbi:hypothetical protein AAIA72_05160 [Hahella sp. SMD15-11]|uniref:AraC family transcriptional regulator n=1 Tax=Thermohahella caldifontis TaxID=3142973 RepID=A0AB39UZB0_9GAMM